MTHSAAYAIARILPGILTFASLALYTRWLTPHEFGRFTLVVAAAALGRIVFFYWLRLSVLRLLPAQTCSRSEFLSTVGAGFLISCGVALAIALGLVIAREDAILALLGVLLVWSYGWLDANLDLLRSDLEPKLYGLLLTWRTACSLALGAFFIKLGGSAGGALLGTALGSLIPGPGARGLFSQWRQIRPSLVRSDLLREMAVFGLPPTAAVAFTFVVSMSDRAFLAWLSGAVSAGLYAAGYDLAQSAVSGLLLPVSLASLPLAVRAMEQGGPDAAGREMERNFILLLLIGLPAAVGLAILAPNAAHLLLGAKFRPTALKVIPWIVFAGLLASLIELHFNRAFQLTKRTGRQIGPYAAAAIVNVGLNLLWIPSLGVMGAVYSTMIAYVLATWLAWMSGRRIFPMHMPVQPTAQIIGATLLMALALWPVRDALGAPALVLQVMLGVVVFGSTLTLLSGDWRPDRALQRLIFAGRQTSDA